MAKISCTVETDGSITFEGDVSEEVRAKAYQDAQAHQDAARARAAATDVTPGDLVSAATTRTTETAHSSIPREKATEVYL